MQSSLHILLIDNEDITHQTVADYLSDSGHDVDRTHNRDSALKAVKDHNYDLVFADIWMLSMDDFSLMINIRKVRPGMPVVIITTYGCMKKVIELLKLGAMDYILEPIKLLELDAVLEKSIRFHNIMN